MSLSVGPKPVLSLDDEAIAKEARRLYSTTFGKLLEDTDETPSFICEHLFLGSATDARNLEKLHCHQIKYVLNMTGLASYPEDFFVTSDHPDITLLIVDAHDEDNYNIASHFPTALHFIQKSLNAKDGAVLVHCAAGVSRSATIVAAYLITAHNLSTSEAVLRINEARPCACPNIGFLQQLIRFERSGFQLL